MLDQSETALTVQVPQEFQHLRSGRNDPGVSQIVLAGISADLDGAPHLSDHLAAVSADDFRAD
jgi:hypothetical protein